MRPAFHRQVDPTRVGPTCLWEDDLMHAWNTTHTCMVGTLQFYLHYFPFVVESVLKLLKLFSNGNYMIYLFIESDLRFFSTIFTTYVTGQGQLHTIGSCESCDQTKVLITNERRLWQKLCTYIFYQKNLPWIVFVTSDMKSRSISHLPDNNSNKKDDCKNFKKN